MAEISYYIGLVSKINNLPMYPDSLSTFILMAYNLHVSNKIVYRLVLLIIINYIKLLSYQVNWVQYNNNNEVMTFIVYYNGYLIITYSSVCVHVKIIFLKCCLII